MYFVMYGHFALQSKKIEDEGNSNESTPKSGKFGELLGLGWTIGEEILYDEKSAMMRMESCITTSKGACVLRVSINDLAAMSSQKAAIGGGGMLIKDYEILLSFLEKNYEVK